MAQTVVELFEEQVHRSSLRPALRRHHDGVWEEFNWKEWWDGAERFAAGLMAEGVERSDNVALLISTRLEWAVADMGLSMAGAVCVALDVATSANELARILADNDIDTVIVEDPVQLGKVIEAQKESPTVRRVVYVDDDVLVRSGRRQGGDFVRLESLVIPSKLTVESFDEVRARGQAALADDPRYVARRRRQIDGESEATILYTAGVSGEPRGVVLTHGNLVAQVEGLSALQVFSSDDVQLLFLPLAHIFARLLYLSAVGYGMATVFGRGPDYLVEDLAEVRPTLLASVPRIYERLQAEIIERIEERRWRSRLLPVALEVGKTVSQRIRSGDDPGAFLRLGQQTFSHLLLEDVRDWLGGRMRFLISGGAPLEQEIAEFFFTTGLLLLEGYGLTETSGAVAFNMPDDFRFGSVGKPLPGVDVTIAEDGEILVRGQTVMRQYVAEDEQGHRAIDDDGWLHTGDIGRFDSDGFLYLTDRKQQLIVTSTGKHIVPSNLEEALVEAPLVAHAVVVGEGRPHLAALLALDPDAVLDFVDDRSLDGDRPVRELTGHTKLRQKLRRHVGEVNRRQSASERIRTFVILSEFLSARNRTLTSSGKVRRAEVLRRFEAEIESLYVGGPDVETVDDG